MTDGLRPTARTMIDETLDELFRTHDLVPQRSGSVFRIADYPELALCGEASCPVSPHVIQLDVLLRLADGRTLCESCAGLFGDSLPALLSDALASFAQGAFPVLLAAFFGRPSSGVSHETWTIDGMNRDVYLGAMTYRYAEPGGPEGAAAFSGRLFDWIEDWVRKSSLPPGDHWIRVYHMHRDGKLYGNEVLLDNTNWPEAEEALSRFEWPSKPDLSDARVFLVIRDRA